MSGQTMSFKEKGRLEQELIQRVNPYESPEPSDIDLHGYARYVRENNIPNDQIDERIWSMFRRLYGMSNNKRGDHGAVVSLFDALAGHVAFICTYDLTILR